MNVLLPKSDEALPDDRRSGRSPRPPASRRRKVFWFILIAILLVLVIGGLVGMNVMKNRAMTQFFNSMQPPPAAVAVADAKSEPVPRSVAAIGSFAAVRQVTVSPEVGGRIDRIFFEAGASVKAGDPLVQINDQPERADLANYRAQISLAQTTLQRTQALASRDYATRATLDQNKAALEQAEAGVARVQALIAQKLVKAPFDGDLGVRQVNLGQYLQPGTAVVTLTDLSRLFVNFTVPEQNRARIRIGQTVRATVDAFPGRTFEGRITAVEPQVNVDTRTISLQATFDNPNKALLPGMFANVAVVLPPEDGAITVPETAIDYSIYGDSVWVVRDAGKDDKGNQQFKTERVAVKTGERFNNRAVVLEGLKPNDRVVVSGQNRLIPGGPVAINDQPPPPVPAAVPRN